MRFSNIALVPLALASIAWPGHAQNVTPAPRAETGIRTRYFFSDAGDSSRAMIGVSTTSSGDRDTLGLLIESITPNGPADKAGIVEGDRIIAINGTRLTVAREDLGEDDMRGLTTRRLVRELEKVKAGDVVTLDLWSEGARKTVKVTTASAGSLMGSNRMTRDDYDNRAVVGLDLQPTGSTRDTLGPMIMRIEANGPADKAGLIEGDRVLSVDNQDLRVARADAGDEEVASAKANRFSRLLRGKKPGDVVTLKVYSGGQVRSVSVKTASSKDVYGEMRDRMRFRIGGMGMEGMVMPPMPPMPPMPAMPRIELNFDRQQMTDATREAARQAEIAGIDAARVAADALQSVDVGAIDRAAEAAASSAASAADAATQAYRDQINELQQQIRDLQRRTAPETHTTSYEPQSSDTPTAATSSFSSASVDDHGVIHLPGLKLSPVNDDLASYLGAGSRDGLFVAEADARWAQLHQGDVILRVNGEPVARGDMAWFSVNLDQHNRMDVLRAGKPVSVVVGKK